MAKNTIEPQNEPEVMIEEAINQSENFIYKNGKQLIAALVVIIVVVGGYFTYTQAYSLPRQEKASAMMFVAQQSFAQQSYSVALNGDGSNAGFLEVIANYKSTPQSNIAHHYAGVCYMHMGEYENALAQLSSYKAIKGLAAETINAQNLGLQGDAYVQLANQDKALEMYKSAVAASANVFTAPYYLFKLGGLCQSMGDNSNALAAYKRIRDEYASSMEAQTIAKYIGQIEQED